MRKFETYAKVLDVQEELGLVLGWGIVCTENGEPYFDLQKDHIPEHAMLKAATDFMQSSRAAKEMHCRSNAGEVIFAFPMTAEIQKAFDITCPKTGLMIILKPDETMLGKFKSGELTGFSIGGVRGKDKVVED
jgi:hypothetical protein